MQSLLAWFKRRRKFLAILFGVFGVHLLHLGDREDVLTRALPEIHERLATGAVRPVLDRTFPLDRDGAVAAHRVLHARENLGKVVLSRAPDG